MAGPDGHFGSYWPLVGDLLIERGFAQSIVFSAVAKGGTSVTSWADRGDLGGYAARRLDGITGVTHVVWHQGETDARMPPEQYRETLLRVFDGLRLVAPRARFVVAQASICFDLVVSTPIVAVQAGIVDPSRGIYAGPNTDTLTSVEDRYDGCHFSGAGAAKVAAMWADAIVAAGR